MIQASTDITSAKKTSVSIPEEAVRADFLTGSSAEEINR